MTKTDIPASQNEIAKVEGSHAVEDTAASGQALVATATTTRTTTTGREPGLLSILAIGALVIGFYAALGMGIAAFFSSWAKSFWVDYWTWVIGAFLLVGAFLAAALWFESWLNLTSEETKRKVLTLVTIPAITAAIMGLIAFGSTQYLTLAAQLIMIPVTALLPAVTYFLFLTTRRPSILNEFIANLGRLGLLARNTAPANAGAGTRDESAAERGARVESYFQRFESIYGPLRFESSDTSRSEFVSKLIDSVDNPNVPFRLPQATVFLGDIFRANLVIPIGLATILATLGWVLVLQPNFSTTEMAVADVAPKNTALNFAFLGAYFFGLQMLFRRFVRRDLSPNAYFAFSNRIILAVIGVWLVVAIYPSLSELSQISLNNAALDKLATASPSASPKPADVATASPGGTEPGATKVEASKDSPPHRTEVILLLLAFTIGVFPRVVWQFLSVATTKLLRVKFVLPSVEAAQPLNELDGLTVWHETRLEEEDVENVPNMASVDVVEVMLYTQIPMERLVSWIDQAILLTVLGVVGGDTRTKLRKLGLRTATQVIELAVQNVTVLRDEIGAGQQVALVAALQKEANFDRVRAWRATGGHP